LRNLPSGRLSCFWGSNRRSAGFAEVFVSGFPGGVGRRQASGTAAGFPDGAKWHGIGGISVLKPGLACFGHSEPAPCRVLRGVSRRESRGVGRLPGAGNRRGQGPRFGGCVAGLIRGRAVRRAGSAIRQFCLRCSRE